MYVGLLVYVCYADELTHVRMWVYSCMCVMLMS